MTPGTIKENEYHPAANSAMAYVKNYLRDIGIKGVFRLRESFASSALSGNRLAEICLETLNRICSGDVVSDRYLLGLAWTLNTMEAMSEEEVVSKIPQEDSVSNKPHDHPLLGPLVNCLSDEFLQKVCFSKNPNYKPEEPICPRCEGKGRTWR